MKDFDLFFWDELNKVIGQKYSRSDQSIVSFNCFTINNMYIVEQSLEKFLESSLK